MSVSSTAWNMEEDLFIRKRMTSYDCDCLPDTSVGTGIVKDVLGFH